MIYENPSRTGWKELKYLAIQPFHSLEARQLVAQRPNILSKTILFYISFAIRALGFPFPSSTSFA